MEEFQIVIVGAGPAGSAAAIELSNLDPEYARRTLVLEKAVFPRPKLCGGGVTAHADDILAQLGVRIDVPSVPIHTIGCVYEDVEFEIPWQNAFRVVRREEFDAALARHVQARGVNLREGEGVLDFHVNAEGVEIQTERSAYRAQVIIGADGANSTIRRKMGLVHGDRISRLMEIATPVSTPQARQDLSHKAVFDWTPVASGVQGYYWDFPVEKNGQALMNRGIFDSRIHAGRPLARLKPVFTGLLAARSVDPAPFPLQGHPERWFDSSSRHSAERIILAGDAAGTEPFLGEGISHALDFGRVAARAAMDAIKSGDYAFTDYERRIGTSPLGRRLWFKRILAQIAYADQSWRFYRLGFGLMRLVFGPRRGIIAHPKSGD